MQSDIVSSKNNYKGTVASQKRGNESRYGCHSRSIKISNI